MTDSRDRRYTRKAYLEYAAAIVDGGSPQDAELPPDADLDEELTWAEWQEQ